MSKLAKVFVSLVVVVIGGLLVIGAGEASNATVGLGAVLLYVLGVLVFVGIVLFFRNLVAYRSQADPATRRKARAECFAFGLGVMVLVLPFLLR